MFYGISRGWGSCTVEQLSHLNPRNSDDCQEYYNDDYEKCVDEELQKVWKPLINCNPPWLSSKDQCVTVNNIQETGADSEGETVFGIYNMKNYPAMERCPKACTVLQPNIFYTDEEKD